MKKSLQKRIADIEKLGYKVEIEHHREYYPAKHITGTMTYFDPELKPQGGYTLAYIMDGTKEENIIAKGLSECSVKDNYNRKIGASIALGRAEKELYTEMAKKC